MPFLRKSIGPAAAIAALVLLIGCGSDGDGGSGSATKSTTSALTATGATSDLLVDVIKSGGLCATGVCGEQVAIYRDGSWTRADNGKRSTGKLTAKDTADLRALVEEQGPSIDAIPRTRVTCPSAADGQDVMYKYYFSGRMAEVSNCQVDLTASNRLLSLTTRILDKIG